MFQIKKVFALLSAVIFPGMSIVPVSAEIVNNVEMAKV